MTNPFTWAVPLGRVFGITLRIHLLFIAFALVPFLRVAFEKKPLPAGIQSDMAILVGILFVSVLLHEFGHCLGARLVDGDAHEILIWPLGGLATVDVPHTPRAHAIAAGFGPLVNLGICLIAGFFFLWLTGFAGPPPFNPFWVPWRVSGEPVVFAELFTWRGEPVPQHQLAAAVLLARVFWLNWVLFLVNVLLIGLPLDGGRLFQCAFWPWTGFRQATLYTIYMGFVTAIGVGMAGVIVNEVLPLILAGLIYFTSQRQWIILETGGEDALFGYDFSQGFTGLEEEPAAARRKQPNILQRWRQRRALRKRQREQEQRATEERRMDELLEKVQREGLAALTDEERRFLKRVSERYKHR
jgi:stage IV sporulation protein FB